MSCAVGAAQAPGIRQAQAPGIRQAQAPGGAEVAKTANVYVLHLFCSLNQLVFQQGQHICLLANAHNIGRLLSTTERSGSNPSVSFDEAVGNVKGLDSKLLQCMLDYTHPMNDLRDLRRPHALLQAAKDISAQYWDLVRSMYTRCSSHVDLCKAYSKLPRMLSLRDTGDDRYLWFLKRGQGHGTPGDCCGWHGVMALKSPRSNILGALIMSYPCQSCTSNKTGETQDGVYLGELAALSLLLARQQRDALQDNHELGRANDSHHQAVVINMTPTEVRIIQATVRDPSSPTITISRVESFAHDVNGPEHLTKRHKDQWLSCEGCRKVLSWLFFLPTPDDPSAAVGTTSLHKVQPARVISGSSEKSTSSEDSTGSSGRSTSSVSSGDIDLGEEEVKGT